MYKSVLKACITHHITFKFPNVNIDMWTQFTMLNIKTSFFVKAVEWRIRMWDQ